MEQKVYQAGDDSGKENFLIQVLLDLLDVAAAAVPLLLQLSVLLFMRGRRNPGRAARGEEPQQAQVI